MQVHIRPGSNRDRHQLIEIQTLAIETFYKNEYSPTQIEALRKKQAEAINELSQSFLVAEIEGETVGFASLSQLASQIDAVYIHPQWMHRGIGRKLVAALEKLAQKKGRQKLTVIAAPITSPFYETQGYQVVSTYPYALDNGEILPCNLLEKPLPSSLKPTFYDWYFSWFLFSVITIALWNRFSPHMHQPNPHQSPPQHSNPKNKKGRISHAQKHTKFKVPLFSSAAAR
jgi:GNAT superfamily N-acetyltransferase